MKIQNDEKAIRWKRGFYNLTHRTPLHGPGSQVNDTDMCDNHHLWQSFSIHKITITSIIPILHNKPCKSARMAAHMRLQSLLLFTVLFFRFQHVVYVCGSDINNN